MFGVFFKTLNTKLSKTIINGPTKLRQNSTKDQVYYPSISNDYLLQNLNKENFNRDKNYQNTQNYKQKLTQCLNQPLFIIPKTQQNFVKSNIEKIKNQFIHNLQNIKSTQFQANKQIQDRLIFSQLKSIQGLCLNIFDGHGGSNLAEYASKKIVQLIDIFLNSKIQKIIDKFSLNMENIIKQSIEWAYQQIQDNFYEIFNSQFKSGNKQIFKIGSCAITVIIYNELIIVGSLGDSQALIVYEQQEQLKYLQINQQLSAKNPKQIQRLQKQFKNKDQQIFVKRNGNKIYLKGYLQPTKSLGDYYLKKQEYYKKLSDYNKKYNGPYLNCKPQFNTIKISKNFKYLIVGSDGLWDFIQKYQIIQTINAQQEFNNSQQEICFDDLNKSYHKISTTQFNQMQFPDKLKEIILQNCANKKGININKLLKLSPGQRRNYCDDISIITYKFIFQNT